MGLCILALCTSGFNIADGVFFVFHFVYFLYNPFNVFLEGGELPIEEAGAQLPQRHRYWWLQLRHPQEALYSAGSHWTPTNPAPGEDTSAHAAVAAHLIA